MNSMGPQLLLQTALYARIGIATPPRVICFELNLAFISGITHLAWLSSETFRHCYRSSAPFEDHLKSTFRSCQLVSPVPAFPFQAAHIIKLAQQGRYNEASAQMAEMSPERFQSLKTGQYWAFFSGALQLRRKIYKYALSSSSFLPSVLRF